MWCPCFGKASVPCPVKDSQCFLFKIFFAPWFVNIFMLFSHGLDMRRVEMAFESYGKVEIFRIVPELNRRICGSPHILLYVA